MKSIYSIIALLILSLSCNYVQKIKDGPMAYDRKQYTVAIKMLKKEFSKEKSRVERGKIAYMLGDSYKQTNKNADAIEWYKTAYDNSYGIDALKEYSYALKANEQYKEAKIAFKELGIEIGSPYEYRREILACQTALDWKEAGKESVYSVKNSAWNSGASDYSPTFYENNQVVFTSDRAASTGDDTYNWTGGNFSDLFILNPSNNNVVPFPKPINTEHNEGTVSFNSDFTEMVFTRCFGGSKREDSYCQLLMSTREDGTWTTPVVLNFIKEGINYAHPALTEDGSTLYFSCNDPEGWGNYDIWVSNRTPDGWSDPQLLSRSINTIGNEQFPYVDKDTLYFSSDHHTSMGGLDIFKTFLLDGENWARALNLKAPINSGADDFGFVIDYNAQLSEDILQAGYFTSTRFDGQGGDDIYRYQKSIPPPPPPVDTTTPPPPIEYKLVLDGYILEKIYEDPSNPNSKLLGRKPLAKAKVDIKSNGKSKRIEVDENGFFSMNLEEDTDYSFFASQEGYLNNSERFSTRGIGKDPNNPVQKFEVEIVLDKIFKDKEIVLDNIYYDLNKWDIRSDAQPTLNVLATTLIQNPTIRIMLASHTDCRGQNAYNQTLSQKRAQSAVNYLISKGVDSRNLEAIGYGESAPADDCVCQRCTEEEHQRNRRTTFKIVD